MAMVKLLLARHADYTLKDKNGLTALDYAKDRLAFQTDPDERKEDRRFVQLLKQAGAKE